MKGDVLIRIFQKLDRVVERENTRRRRDESFLLARATFKVLGQFSLLSHPDPLLSRLDLAATVDLDAWVESEYFILIEFKKILGKEGLTYDEDSPKIWLPKEATFTRILETSRITVFDVDPLFALTSKAIKAKEKNRPLIREALNVYGRSLRDLIEKHGGDLAYFK